MNQKCNEAKNDFKFIVNLFIRLQTIFIHVFVLTIGDCKSPAGSTDAVARWQHQGINLFR